MWFSSKLKLEMSLYFVVLGWNFLLFSSWSVLVEATLCSFYPSWETTHSCQSQKCGISSYPLALVPLWPSHCTCLWYTHLDWDYSSVTSSQNCLAISLCIENIRNTNCDFKRIPLLTCSEVHAVMSHCLVQHDLEVAGHKSIVFMSIPVILHYGSANIDDNADQRVTLAILVCLLFYNKLWIQIDVRNDWQIQKISFLFLNMLWLVWIKENWTE